MFVVLFSSFENIVSGEVSARRFIIRWVLIAAFFCWLFCKSMDSGLAWSYCRNPHCDPRSKPERDLYYDSNKVFAPKSMIGKDVPCPQCGYSNYVEACWWENFQGP